MDDWTAFISEVENHVSVLSDDGCDIPFFRGHSDSDWKLLCDLGRKNDTELKKKNLETILYYDFVSRAGAMLGPKDSSWDTLFTMQHHGLPTRLPDWSATFAVALYFAVRPYIILANIGQSARVKNPPCIWILNPFKLNELANGSSEILNPNLDMDDTYLEYFVRDSKKFPADILAINPTHMGRRLSVQRGAFTLHSELYRPLEDRYGTCIKKITLPKRAIRRALSFLLLSGMNEYSLFPDLDGLARFLRMEPCGLEVS